ncbi:MAG: hypothetical protein FWG47_04885, partial [Propionibacteriaceae bacterium]|nr:hypothetical protein [Propionibacteriaceae bacterium]
ATSYALSAMDTEAMIMWIPWISVAMTMTGVILSLISSVMMAGVADGYGRRAMQPLSRLIMGGLKAIPRTLPLLLICAAGILLLFAALGWWLKQLFEASITNNNQALGQISMMGVLVIALILLAFVPLSYLLSVKLFLLAPVLHCESASGLKLFSRTWGMTKGASGMILLIILVAGIAEGVIAQIASFATGLFSVNIIDSPGAYYDLNSALTAMAPVLVITGLIGIAVAAVFTPLLTCASVVIYHDRLRMRNEVSPSPVVG